MNGKDKEGMVKPSVLLAKYLPFEATQGQKDFFIKMDEFFKEGAIQTHVFILRGYAGTGKTSLISALVKTLPKLKVKSMLLAPTGRAAKVMGNYSNKSAFTIHKIIYRPKDQIGEFGAGFDLMKNYYKETLFIIDEASMLADESFNGRSLLRDLIQYVFQESSNRLLLVGDTAQLPPVGSTLSPALDKRLPCQAF
jgi:ATP-dependent exoDNAse (exonuclease V) alpha subunit